MDDKTPPGIGQRQVNVPKAPVLSVVPLRDRPSGDKCRDTSEGKRYKREISAASKNATGSDIYSLANAPRPWFDDGDGTPLDKQMPEADYDRAFGDSYSDPAQVSREIANTPNEQITSGIMREMLAVSLHYYRDAVLHGKKKDTLLFAREVRATLKFAGLEPQAERALATPNAKPEESRGNKFDKFG